ncbi:MAG: hypothetical protein LBQ40_04500 [Clostridiales bacterium]|jgi:hypothetical protein|nr:hypothetical protein [Clostridiales bacterium]
MRAVGKGAKKPGAPVEDLTAKIAALQVENNELRAKLAVLQAMPQGEGEPETLDVKGKAKKE